jgi:hypothetical protein
MLHPLEAEPTVAEMTVSYPKHLDRSYEDAPNANSHGSNEARGEKSRQRKGQ